MPFSSAVFAVGARGPLSGAPDDPEDDDEEDDDDDDDASGSPLLVPSGGASLASVPHADAVVRTMANAATAKATREVTSKMYHAAADEPVLRRRKR